MYMMLKKAADYKPGGGWPYADLSSESPKTPRDSFAELCPSSDRGLLRQ